MLNIFANILFKSSLILTSTSTQGCIICWLDEPEMPKSYIK